MTHPLIAHGKKLLQRPVPLQDAFYCSLAGMTFGGATVAWFLGASIVAWLYWIMTAIVLVLLVKTRPPKESHVGS